MMPQQDMTKHDVAQKDAEIAELKVKLAHREELICALGNVLENFSIVVLMSVERMEKARGVMGKVSNPWG